jgi:hypothetical protein
MSRPTHHSRDDVYRRLPDGTEERVEGVVPRVELDRLLDALRKERDATNFERARIREVRHRLLLLAGEHDVERVMRTLRELSEQLPQPQPPPPPPPTLMDRVRWALRWPR